MAAADLRQLVFDLRRALPGDAIPLAHGFVSRQAGPQLAAGALGHAAPPIQQLGKIRFRLAGIPVELRGDVIQPALLHPFAAVGVLLKIALIAPGVAAAFQGGGVGPDAGGGDAEQAAGARFMDRLAQLLDQLVHALAAEIVQRKAAAVLGVCLGVVKFGGGVEVIVQVDAVHRVGLDDLPGARHDQLPHLGEAGVEIQVALAQAHKGRVLMGPGATGPAG